MRAVAKHGGPRPTELLLKLCDVLGDQQWHPLEAVVAEAGKVIPPGIAMRRTERERKYSGPEQRVKAREPERLIQLGKASIVKEVLYGANFERKHEGDRILVRMATLPQRVRYERSRLLVDRLLASHDAIGEVFADGVPKVILGQLTYEQLFQVALELANRERERALYQRGVAARLAARSINSSPVVSGSRIG